MIYDRTATDVSNAIALQRSKAAKDYTTADKEILERGMLTLSTLNRIEHKQAYLGTTFANMGYYTSISNKDEWTYTDVFTRDDLVRICDNNSKLRTAFFALNDTPENAKPIYHYEQINRLERVLHDLDSMIDVVESYIMECDTFYCGEY